MSHVSLSLIDFGPIFEDPPIDPATLSNLVVLFLVLLLGGIVLGGVLAPALRFVRKFSLKSLFVAVTLVACGLGYFAICRRVPISNGALYFAFCYRQDWGDLTASTPEANQTDVGYTAISFPQSDPAELLDGFNTRPVLWPKIELGRGSYAEDSGTILFSTVSRFRRADRPVDGFLNYPGPGDVSDQVMMQGTFERSALTGRCFVNFDVSTRSSLLSRTEIRDLHRSTNAIRYSDSPSGELLVFAIPIDSELVQLIIIDLVDQTPPNGAASAASAGQ